jgi:hypothetical protein
MLIAVNAGGVDMRGCPPHLHDFFIYLRSGCSLAALKEKKLYQTVVAERKFITILQITVARLLKIYMCGRLIYIYIYIYIYMHI